MENVLPESAMTPETVRQLVGENQMLKVVVRNCNQSLKNACATMESLKSELAKSQDFIQRQYVKARQVVDSLQKQIIDKNNELADLKEKMLMSSQLEESVTKLTDELQITKRLLADSNRETENVKQQNILMTVNLQAMTHSLADSEQLLASKCEENRNLSLSLSNLRVKFDELLDLCNVFNSTKMSLDDEVNRLKARICALEESGAEELRLSQRKEEEYKLQIENLKAQVLVYSEDFELERTYRMDLQRRLELAINGSFAPHGISDVCEFEINRRESGEYALS